MFLSQTKKKEKRKKEKEKGSENSQAYNFKLTPNNLKFPIIIN